MTDYAMAGVMEITGVAAVAYLGLKWIARPDDRAGPWLRGLVATLKALAALVAIAVVIAFPAIGGALAMYAFADICFSAADQRVERVCAELRALRAEMENRG